VAETILFPPGAAVVSQFLNDALADSGEFDGVTAAGLIPNPRPTSFVRVRTGGGIDIDIAATEATVYVESYAARYADAAVLSEFCHACLLRGAREGWLGDWPVRSVDVVSRPQDLPDPLTDQPRMTATYAVRLRGYAL
jgi:hypothetical protein